MINLPLLSELAENLNEYNFLYYFVANKAFPLTSYVLWPYPQRTLDNVKRIYNNRLGRVRKTVEYAFGMIAEKFKVLNGAIRCRTTERVAHIMKAACILHNFIRTKEGV